MLDYLQVKKSLLASQAHETDHFSPKNSLTGNNIVHNAVNGFDDYPSSPESYSNDLDAKPIHPNDSRSSFREGTLDQWLSEV